MLYTAAEKPGLISDVMIAKKEFIKENPAVFQALALAWGDAINYLRENPDDGGKIIADAVGSPMDEFEVAFKGVQVFDLAENKEQLEGPFLETFTTVGDIMKGINPDEIKEVPDPKEVVTAEFVQEKGQIAFTLALVCDSCSRCGERALVRDRLSVSCLVQSPDSISKGVKRSGCPCRSAWGHLGRRHQWFLVVFMVSPRPYRW